MSPTQQRTAHQWTPAKVEATKRELLRRAAEDRPFRQRCLDDAPAAIKEVSGLDLPADGPRIRFVERLEELVIVLPSMTDSDNEVSDEDLELIAGGGGAADSGKLAKVVGSVSTSAKEARRASISAE